MKRMLGRLFVASLLVSVSTSAIYAQNDGDRGERRERGERGDRGPGRQFGGGMRGGNIAFILAIPDVAAELKLDDTQKEELQAARRAQEEEVRKLFSNGQGGPGAGGPRGGGPGGFSEENRAKFEELNAKVDEKLADILDPDQFKRVLGIYAQTDAARSLSHPLIAKEIGVSESQIADIKKIQEESGAKLRELMRGGFSEDTRTKMQAARQEVSDKVLAVLSDEQKTKFEELKGAKFELPQGPFGGGRGFGGGPGRGGERGDRGGDRGGDRPRGDRPRGDRDN